MSKKILSILLVLIVAVGLLGVPASAADELVASPTAASVVVNFENVEFDAYNINDNNYFKLRDIAFILNGTKKQFEVSWNDEENAISLKSNKPYTVVGGEMTGKGEGNKTATPTDSKLLLNNTEYFLIAYNIDGNNYFKLRDLGRTFNFGVDWDGEKNTIVIDTSKDYKSDKALVATYEEWPMVPDFGVLDGVEFTRVLPSGEYNGHYYSYYVKNPPQEYVGAYCELLAAHGFSYRFSYGEGIVPYFIFTKDNVRVLFYFVFLEFNGKMSAFVSVTAD